MDMLQVISLNELNKYAFGDPILKKILKYPSIRN